MEMGIRSAASVLRMSRAGENLFLESADNILAPFKDRRFVAGTVSSIFNHLFGANIVEHALGNTAGHGITIGTSLLEDPLLKEADVRSIWRLKSRGSLAIKLANGRPAPDILGITVVTEDVDDVAKIYQHVVADVIKGIGEKRLKPSDEKTPFDIRGGSQYLHALTHAIGPNTVPPSLMHTRLTANGYQVGKLTFKYTRYLGDEEIAVPVEIQVQTEHDRLMSRVGRAAHIAYKMESDRNLEFDVKTLEAIRDRALQIKKRGQRDLLPGTIDSSEPFRRKIAAASRWEPRQTVSRSQGGRRNHKSK